MWRKCIFLPSAKGEKQDLSQKEGKEGGHIRVLYASFEMVPISL